MARKIPFNTMLEDLADAQQHLNLLMTAVGSAESSGKWAGEIWKTAGGHSNLVIMRVMSVSKIAWHQWKKHVQHTCRHDRIEHLPDGHRVRCLDCNKRYKPKQRTTRPILDTL